MSELFQQTAYENPEKSGQNSRWVPPHGSRPESQRMKIQQRSTDSGVYLFNDSMGEEEQEKIYKLLDDEFHRSIKSISKVIGKTITNPEVVIDLELGSRRDRTNSLLKGALVPNASYLSDDNSKEKLAAVPLGEFLQEFVAEAFEVDGREIHLENLQKTCRWEIDLLFEDIQILDDQEVLNDSQIILLSERINNPLFQLANATLLRLILKYFQKYREVEDSSSEIMISFLGDEHTKTDVPRMVRARATGTAIHQSAVKEMSLERTKSNAGNALYASLERFDPELFISSPEGNGGEMIAISSFMSSYIKVSHLRSRAYIEPLPAEYIDHLAHSGLKLITSGVRHTFESELTSIHLSHMSSNINESSDPIIQATRDYVIRSTRSKSSAA